MTEPKSTPHSLASSSNGTQVSDSSPVHTTGHKIDERPKVERTISRQARHEDIAFFSPDGDLQRSVSRQQVRPLVDSLHSVSP